jgi:NADH dehydrogenase FAD-containing subunit
MKGTTPKTKLGKKAVARLGRTKKTGGFARIAKKAAKEYGSADAGKKVAAAIYWKKVRARGGE